MIFNDEIRFLHQDTEYFSDSVSTGLRATIQDVTNLRNAQQQAHRSTYYDELTSLPNRLLLAQELENRVYASKTNKQTVALLAIDLDEFKRVNDSLGHSVGDKVLREVSDILRASVRTIVPSVNRVLNNEGPQDSVISRMGGDEFVVVLSDFQRRNTISAPGY